MSDAFRLDAVDNRRGFLIHANKLIDERVLAVDLAQGKRRYQIYVDRGSTSKSFTAGCSCGASHTCAHVEFVVQVIDAAPRARAWLEHRAQPAAVATTATAIATATAAAGATMPAPSPKVAPKPRPAPRVRDAASERFDQWMRELSTRSTANTAVTTKIAAPRVALFYMTPNLDEDGLDVTVWVGQERKTGGHARTRQLDLAKALRGTAKLTPGDLGLIAALRGHSSSGWRDAVTLAGDVNALVAALLDTGRCYLEGSEPQLLTHGDPRPGKLGWKTDGNGAQAPCTLVDDGVYPLLFDRPMYVDAHTGAIGTLEFGQPLPLVRAFLAGPVVMPEAAAQIAPSARVRLGRLDLPPPRAMTVVKGQAAPPRPQLQLYTTPISPGHFLEPLAVDGAHLRFVYGSATFDEDSDGESFREIEGDVVRVLTRRRDLEQAAAAELDRLGFKRIVDVAAVKHVHAVRAEMKYRRSVLDRTLSRSLDAPDVDAWTRFLHTERRALVQAGWQIELDRTFRHATAQVGAWFVGARALASNAWFQLEVGIEVDGERFDLLPVLLRFVQECTGGELPALLNKNGAESAVLPLADGRKIVLPLARLRQMVTALLEMQAGSKIEKGKLHVPRLLAPQVLALEQHVDKLEWHDALALRELAHKLASFAGVTPVAAPKTLAADLREYQREGLAWLQFLREHELSGILADDMGLGKTVQALAHIATEKAAGRLDRPCLVVSPTSVVANWAQECARFAPELRVLVLHGANRSQSFTQIGEVDVVLTTYPLVIRDVETLQAQPFHLLILDEAQAIKNAGAKAARVLRTLDARHRLCLTGTPLENNLTELWAQFDFLMPGLLGDSRTFGRVFRGPIEKRGDGDRRAALVHRIRPFLLRRSKNVVARELPPKTEIARAIELTGPQRDLYETIRLSVHDRVRQAIAEKGIEQAQIIILDALLKLRQVCCDPRLVKLDAAKKVKTSAKLDTLMELVPSLIEDGRRILLFSQFTSMLALIEPELQRRKIEYVQIIGDTKDRKTPVERFQAGAVPVFLISLKAGGTGLNLTAADTVIHYDPWWNPAVEQQATDRAHRIGQDKPVFVYKLLAAGTVEERIGKLQERKRALAAGLLDGGERQGAALTRADVDALFASMNDDAE